MENLNSVCICGNLVAAPSLKTDTVLTFTVAVNERRKNDDDEWVDYPNFIDCVMFGARCKALDDILDKGMKVAVCGKLHQNKWENEDGDVRSRIEIVANNIEIMTMKLPEDKTKKGSTTKKVSKR